MTPQEISERARAAYATGIVKPEQSRLGVITDESTRLVKAQAFKCGCCGIGAALIGLELPPADVTIEYGYAHALGITVAQYLSFENGFDGREASNSDMRDDTRDYFFEGQRLWDEVNVMPVWRQV